MPHAGQKGSSFNSARAALARDGAAAFWAALDAELDLWHAAGRRATFYWRDDDAALPAPALDRLLALSAETGVPLALAVIPARCVLSPAMLPASVRVLQHGYAHLNHAKGRGEGAAELGLHRPPAQTLAELEEGRKRLADRFGAAFTPALAPPWNRIAPELVPALAAHGFSGLSAAGERAAAEPAPGLRQANIHWDLIDWKRGRGFRGYGSALDLVEHLRRRRRGEADPDEPTGLLSHHLDMDDAGWEFLARLLAATRTHPAASWCDPAALFARSA